MYLVVFMTLKDYKQTLYLIMFFSMVREFSYTNLYAWLGCAICSILTDKRYFIFYIILLFLFFSFLDVLLQSMRMC